MALPTKTTIQGMSYSLSGTPWVRIAPKSGVSGDGLSYSLEGPPFWFIADSAASVPTINVYSGGWVGKPIKTYVGGVWVGKPLKARTGGAWVDT